MKLKTVNVVEVTNGVVNALSSYSEDNAGNRSAEKDFRLLVLARGGNPDHMRVYIEDGRWVDQREDYQVLLVHSE